MRKDSGALLFSATDLVNFLGCQHSTYLDLRQLSQPVEVPPPDETAVLLQQKGLEHERAHLASLKAKGLSVVEIDGGVSMDRRAELTRRAMAAGAELIYQGALIAPPWHGYSDFLVRVTEPSSLGGWSYEVADTKLSRSAEPKHVIQLCVYSDLLAREQGRLPRSMHVVLGDNSTVSLNVAEFVHYFVIARKRFETFCRRPPKISAGEPCRHCTSCRWATLCEAEWESSDHLTLVANITRGQTAKLRDAGVTTMTALAALPRDTKIPSLHAETYGRLRSQAALQVSRRADGENQYELLRRLPGKGFNRLPKPIDGDLFFDMEGDPLFGDGGLEYLFGFAHKDPDGEVRFTALWAHDRVEEKAAFERAVDLIVARLSQYPRAHIYHYGNYEEAALKRLAMYHGTREAEIDDFLRRRKLVDIYKVVREGLRVSEPAYSIKNLETFYLPEKREGEVTTAADSIVIYERWRRLHQPELLNEIERYNETDCRSTRMCRDWLLSLRPEDASWFTGPIAAPADEPSKPSEREVRRREAGERLSAVTIRLLDGVGEAERPWRELVAHLLEFHRREAKPEWWAMFTRLEMSEEELVDDAECIGALRRDLKHPPATMKRSTVHSFRFPPQDFKMRVGDEPLRADTGKIAGEIAALDDETCTISLRISPTKKLPDGFSLIPQGPIDDVVLRGAIYRYAEAVADGDGDRYAAVTAILRQQPPRVTGIAPGAYLMASETEPLAGAVDAIARLNDSCMLVQGPPGTGKTYTSSHAIVELLRRGYRVGVSSLSHKAINHLLACVERVAGKRGVTFAGVKKSSSKDHYLNSGGLIQDTEDNDYACGGRHQLIAGTAWLFARPDLDRALDFLFIDESGQVSLANVVAMGLSARNIVLVGDQMQLSQPIKGTHPGSSGVSAMEYLLADRATVPPERGIFLPTTRRMNPDVCAFISGAIYDDRLRSEAGTEKQRLILRPGAHAALASTGLCFLPVKHDGCSQKCIEEAEYVRRLFLSLLDQQWVDQNGLTHQIGSDDVLVVAPYNMQVNLLKSVLPGAARVGTIDKFQGQEAAVVLLSMATSSIDEMPRNIEFLFSRKRLNVAISRARCLAVVVASPRLLEIPCSGIEQMRLVNTLCWAKRYSDELSAAHAIDVATSAALERGGSQATAAASGLVGCSPRPTDFDGTPECARCG